MINVNINIVMLSFTGLEHNFEKYTTGEVKTLDPMKNFYDFDVSETQDNIKKNISAQAGKKIVQGEPSPVFNWLAQTTAQQTEKLRPWENCPTQRPRQKKWFFLKHYP